jgi:LysR family glycine cleavage system transcriptional activator
MNINKSLPPLNAIKVFEVVARTLNFRIAAEEIGVTHGAVSQQIKLLEDFLGIKLFHRLARGLSLTIEGKIYLPEISQALTQIRAATTNLKPKSNLISLSLTPSFASKWFMPRLGLFKETHPNHDVQILATETITDFSTDLVDVAVRLTTPAIAPNLQNELLFQNRFISICSPKYRADFLEDTSQATLAKQIYLYDTHDHWEDYLSLIFPGHPPKIEKSVRFNQTALAIDAAIDSQGIALVSEILVLDELKNGRVCKPFPQTLEGENGYYMVNPKAKESDKSVLLIKDWLRSQIPPL